MAPHGPKYSGFLPAFVAACALFCLLSTTAYQQGASLRRVTATPEHATSLNPTLSGDGRTIVFESSAPIAGGDAAPQFRTFSADV